MSQENMDAEQTLELYVLDYLVTRNLLQTAMSLVREAKITGDTQSVPYQPGRGLLRGWWDLHTPILGPNDCLAAAYAQFSALTSVRVPSSREQLKHFDAHGVSLPQPQADGQLQSIPGGGSITQHIQGTGIVDNFNVVEMPSLMHGASTMPTNYFGLGGAGFDQGTGGFQPGWGVPSTGTHGNMDPLGANIFLNDGLDEKVSREIISQKRLKNQALAQQPQHHQQHQYSQQSRMAASQQQQLQYQQQQQNLQQSRMASSQQQQLQYQQQQQNLQQLRVKKQQQQQELLQEQQKQQLLQEPWKQQAVKQAFAQQPQVQLQQQEARKRRKPTSATEAGTSKNPVGHFYPAPPLRPSIGTPVGRFLLAGDSGTPAGPTAPTLMTPGLPLAGDNRRYLIDIDTLHDAGLLPTKQQGAKSTGSEDSVTSRNPDDPLAPSTGTPGVELSMARDSGNPVDPPAPSTGTPDVNLKPILKRKEGTISSKPNKRVRFDPACKDVIDETLEEPQDFHTVPQSMEATAAEDAASSSGVESSAVPGYMRNPSKYTRYTFDISADDDKATNKYAFEDFCNLVKKLKPEMKPEFPMELPKAVTFIPRKKACDAMPIDDKSEFTEEASCKEPSQVLNCSAVIAAEEVPDSEVCEMEEDDVQTPMVEEAGSSARKERRYRSKMKTADDSA